VKNQYFGDVNDYAKYGLLRAFSWQLTVSVIWMLTPDDGSNDGKKTQYLEKGLIGDHDRELFAWLADWHRAGASRDVSLIEESGLLPHCRFFREIVPDDSKSRAAWATRARSFSAGAAIVFFDPDNGLSVSSTPPGSRGSSTYVSLEEVKDVWADGCSVLIYQHTARVNRADFIAAKTRELRELTGADQIITFVAVDWIGFLLVQPRHERAMSEAEEEIRERWQGRIHVGLEQTSSRSELTSAAEVSAVQPRDPREPIQRKAREARSSRASRGTTSVEYVSSRNQEVIRRTDHPGTDHGQRIYVLRCGECQHEYGANGSDIFQRRCPVCQKGAAGLGISQEVWESS
jgi:hypothetical protein